MKLRLVTNNYAVDSAILIPQNRFYGLWSSKRLPPEWEFNSYFFYLVKVLFGESVLRGVVDRGDSAALR